MNRLTIFSLIFIWITILGLCAVNGNDKGVILALRIRNGYIKCSGNCGKCDILLSNDPVVNRTCKIKDHSHDKVEDWCCKTWEDFKCLINFATPKCPSWWQDFESGVWNLTAKLSSTTCIQYQYGSDQCKNSASTAPQYMFYGITAFGIIYSLLIK